MAKIYLASSWRNEYQPSLVRALREAGHEVYDFRNPAPGNGGFRWTDVGLISKTPTFAEYKAALANPIAEQGYKLDFDAMNWADTGVLLLPSGRSAHLEAGWMKGSGRKLIVVTRDGEEPELMAKMADHIVGNLAMLLAVL